MATPARSTKLTYEGYVLLPDDGKRHEIIEEDHYATPTPSTRHQGISGSLASALATFLRQHRLGEVFSAPCDVVLSDENLVQPDILLVSRAHEDIVTEANIQGARDLLVEILSERTRRRDEITKRKLYERFAVQEYWIVDPELETMQVYRLSDRVYVRTAELSKETDDILTTPLLPDFRLSPTEIFE